MLSYQHAFHAGNAADVHKHALLAVALDYMVAKAKPLTYVETHAGRALYDLASPEALKTGEAAFGIGLAERWFPKDHPYARAIAAARLKGGRKAYPGSPFIAATLLRSADQMILAERHPAELAALRASLPRARVFGEDGVILARRMLPPEPRRGFLLVDPSYEIKTDYTLMPRLLGELHRKWAVGVLMLWYPILTSGAERPMVAALDALAVEGAIRHEVRFPPARTGHGMTGSGLYLVNPPYGWAEAAAALAARFGPS